VGCRGLCAKDVLVDIIVNSEKTTYQHIKPQTVARIVEEHLVKGEPVAEWIAGDDYYAFHEKQTKVVLSDCGNIDPEKIDAYIEVDGYKAAEKVLKSLTPEKTIKIIKKSGLRGRGGAGFPTGTKWEICSKITSKHKYIICNADEGDPGAFMDRSVIEGNPHTVIEGMMISAYAIGASVGYVYIRAEYPLAVERLRYALKEARERNLLGKNILKSNFDFDIKIKLGAGAFVCGEETALIASIEGKRGMPRAKPPFPVYCGLWGKPTVINNVETLANIPYIIRKGADWFASFGTEKSKGGRTFKAVQSGGPSGGCIPAQLIDIKVDYESLAQVGSIVGSGGMVVLDDTDCMVSIAKFFLEFTQAESCGKCVPCRVGTKRLLEILNRITAGKGRDGDIELLEDLGSDIKASSLCGLGQTAPNPVLSTIKYFRDEYEAHINDLKCPAAVCKELIEFTIIEDICTGCGACLRACPVSAISGEKKKPHKLSSDICIKCGACFDVCKFDAVKKE
jgi:NADH:ubiquinone oxidoreductase subunit F (NADH-binding)/(2Fe-2S) ferredoxin